MEKCICTALYAFYMVLVTAFMVAMLAGTAVWLIVSLFGAPTFHPTEIHG